MNDYPFKLVKSYGDFQIDLRDKTLYLTKGDMVVIPKGVEHKPCRPIL